MRERTGLPHDQVHGTSVGAVDVDDGDIGRVSGQCLRDGVPVPADEHHTTQVVGRGLDEVVDVSALEQTAGDPHDVLVRRETGPRGVRVGRLVDAFAPAAVADLQKVGRQTSAIDAFVLLPDGALLAATDEDRVTVFWQVAP